MKKILILTLILGLVICETVVASEFGDLVAKNSLTYLNVRELTNRNDSEAIDRMLLLTGLDNRAQIKRTKTGYPWCAAFVYTNYYDVSIALKTSTKLPKMARVQSLWKYALANGGRYETYDFEDIVSGVYKPKAGDIFIMRYGPRGTDWNGHTGIILKLVKVSSLSTCEGNTNSAGSREGNGVYIKTRHYNKLEGIIRVRYAK